MKEGDFVNWELALYGVLEGYGHYERSTSAFIV